MRHRELFAKQPKPRRTLMHMFDCGNGPNGTHVAQFRCSKGHETGWHTASLTEIRRGIPCEECAKTINTP